MGEWCVGERAAGVMAKREEVSHVLVKEGGEGEF